MLTTVKTDRDFVLEAYEDAVKRQVDNFFGFCIVEDPESETRFLKGLNIIRKARDRAIELVKKSNGSQAE